MRIKKILAILIILTILSLIGYGFYVLGGWQAIKDAIIIFSIILASGIALIWSIKTLID